MRTLTRGWTLQELLAPKYVVFYDEEWREFGSKSSLIAQISLVAGIQQDHIQDINGASVAQKMSWAAKRQTTRVEDMAYSLMGIFDVNMALLYGEGDKAFTRLQHEIVKISNDESLFAWTDGGLVESGLFAQSPKSFAESGNVVQISSDRHDYIYRAPYTVTHRGLAIEAWANRDSYSTFILDRRFAFLPLNCRRQLTSGHILAGDLAIGLEKVSRDEFVRFSPGQLDPPLWHIDKRSVGLVHIRPSYIRCISHEQRLSLFMDESSLSKRKLLISDSYNCRPVLQWSELSNEPLWRITLGNDESFAGILLQSLPNTSRKLFGIVIHAAESKLSISLIRLSSAQTFHKEMDKHKGRRHYHFSAHAASIRLRDNCWVSITLREKQVGVGQRHYLAEFVPTGENDIRIPQEFKL